VAFNYPVPSNGTVKLELTLVATSAISKFNLVKMDSNTHCSKSTPVSLQNASVIGIALNDATTGNSVTVLMFGILEDASFNFALNVMLFCRRYQTCLIHQIILLENI